MDDLTDVATAVLTSESLRALVELSHAVRATAVDERHLAEQLALAATNHVGGTALVWILPFEGGEPALLAALPPGDVTDDRSDDGGPVPAVLQTGMPAIWAGAAYLPLASATGGVLGVLVARRDGGYTPDDIGYLTALADTAAATLDSARLLTDSAM